MSSSTTPAARLSEYLDKARKRETYRYILQFLAVLSLALIAVTAIGAGFGLYTGFTPNLTNGIRVALLLVTLLFFAFLFWLPSKRLRADKGAGLVERADAAFDGRMVTYLDTRTKNPKQPFLALLARDALAIARRVPLNRIVPTSALVWPVMLLLLVFAALFGFNKIATDPMRNAALHIWWGWNDSTLIVERGIDVYPGNIELLAGEDLTLEIELNGFSRSELTLHAREEGREWQATAVNASADGKFRFTLFRVKSAVEYYVSAALVKSEVYQVSVVQPARLRRIDAEYVYPEWTRKAPESREDITDISGVKNTQVSISFLLDKELQDGTLQIGEQIRDLALVPGTTGNGAEYKATFIISNDTQYQLFDRMLDRLVPISGEYAVIVRGDEAPEVKWVKPGRDISASPVEEVVVEVEATDDFSIESIDLNFSVNAGDWQTVSLPIDDIAQYVFYLEGMGEPEGVIPGVQSQEEDSQQIPEALAGIPMQPGDLISYYVKVSDHDSSVETDMMLIDVRPFERRFSQGQGGAAGGGGGGGGANEGSEISRRQKEILLATWNLQRSSDAAGGDLAGFEDNARLLATLQLKLADQARTLADRSEARELVNQGEEIRQFVDYLREAAEHMTPSAEALTELAFSDAIQPQQKALQLLQRAEALFADIRMTQQEGQGGGGGQQAGQDMAEMFDLEMDLERNQYEQPDRGGRSAPSEQLDDIFDELEELARRQQELAEAARERTVLNRDEKWQQEQLSRELEQLQRDLEAIQEEARNAAGEEAEALERAASELSEQIQRARDAIDDATRAQQEQVESESSQQAELQDNDGSQRNEELSGDGGESAADEQEALQTANNALQEALEGLGDARSEQLLTALDEAIEESNAILQAQRELENEIRTAVDLTRQSIESGTVGPDFTYEDMVALSERKRQLRLRLDNVRNDVQALSERFGGQAPRTRDALESAIERLDESSAAQMLDRAADSLSFGSIAVVVPGESLVTNASVNRKWHGWARFYL